MKKGSSKLAILIITSFLLSGCTVNANNSNTNSITSNNNQSANTSETSPSIDGGDSVDTSEPISNPSEDISNDSSTSIEGDKLPIGNTIVSKPSNTEPQNIKEWVNYDLSSSLPQYFSYIQGNNKVANCFDFYDSEGGGFKFSKLYYGLQTPLITSYKKVEVRLKISTVKNNTKKAEDKPIFHIYSYDKNGNYLNMNTLDQGAITIKSIGSEIKFYIKNIDMAYFELRLNAYPKKGEQCYNFGVNQISVKGWDYE